VEGRRGDVALACGPTAMWLMKPPFFATSVENHLSGGLGV